MKVVFTSDTHGKHRDLVVPPGDMLIHCGDMSMVGEYRTLSDFNAWMGEQPHEFKVVIGGNHDRCLEPGGPETEKRVSHHVRQWYSPADVPAREDALKLFTNFTYLEDSGVELGGLKIWGSPWTPIFNSDFWRFHTKSSMERLLKWQDIPENLDILITHGPPNHILDFTLEKDNAGDHELCYRVRSGLLRKPRVHAFGHIHEDYGCVTLLDRDNPKYHTHFINAAFLDRMYKPVNPPWVWDTELDTITNAR
jgi:hypothetical protein